MGCFTFVKMMMVVFNLLIFQFVVFATTTLVVYLDNNQNANQEVATKQTSLRIGYNSHICGASSFDTIPNTWHFIKRLLTKNNNTSTNYNREGEMFGDKKLKLAGVGIAATGLWVTIDGGSFIRILVPFSDDFLKHANVGMFFITIGFVMILLGMLGCCGAQKESKCLLIMFFSIILIICVAEVGATVVVLIYSQYTEIILRNWAIPGLRNEYGKHQVLTDLWNSTMTTLKCCGFSNYTDFSESYYYQQNGLLYPPTCCITPAGFPCIEENAAFSQVVGCYKKIVKLVQRNVNIVGGLAAGVSAIELAAMGVSIYLYCYLDEKAT